MRHTAILALAALVGCGCSDRAARQAVAPRIADASRPLVFLTYPTEPPCSYTNGNGEIVGRRGGLREWIDETCPGLSKHYAALMGYRRLAAEFRREHGLFDPAPASLLLAESPEAERKLPPSHQAMLPHARTVARKLLAEPDLTTVRAFRARLLAMKDARAAPAAGLRRRLA